MKAMAPISTITQMMAITIGCRRRNPMAAMAKTTTIAPR